MLGNMPPGCFCDMRGYSCPLHRGRELWRFSKDYQLHVAHNVDPNNPGQRATGIAGEAAPGGAAPTVAVDRRPPAAAGVPDVGSGSGSADPLAQADGGSADCYYMGPDDHERLEQREGEAQKRPRITAVP